MSNSQEDKALYLRLLRYVTPYWRLFMIAIFGMVVFAITEPAVPALLKPMLDGAFVEQDPEWVRLIPFLFIGVFIIKGVAAYASGAALHAVANKVILDLRKEMYQRLLACPVRFFDATTSGSLVSKFTYDVIQVKDACTAALTVLVRDTLAVIGLLGWMFYMDWKLALIALISAPFIVVVVTIIKKRLRLMSRRVQRSMGEINHALQEAIGGIRLIKLYDGYKKEQEQFYQLINHNRAVVMKFSMAAVLSSPLVQIITAIFLAIIIYVATQQALAGDLSVGEFMSFIGAMAMLLGPLKRLVAVNEYIQRGLAASESVFSMIDEPIELEGIQLEQSPARIQGDISIKSLNFSYPESDAVSLNNISLDINAGETVALVGASGAGKSTLISLLSGFYALDKGMIFIDGHDLSTMSLASLRANIALVSQDVFLFNDTVRNNIAFGALDECSDEQIQTAAEAAYAMEFIVDLPQKMNTKIGSGGTKLSGGQRQRLAIARALLKDAPILILDEATSALDSVSERQIQSALDVAREGRTCIVIAHRLSTVENADRVLVLDAGRIVESGTHQQLLEQQGTYAEMHNLQFKILDQ